MDAGACEFGPCSTAFPSHWQRGGSVVEQPEFEAAPVWDAGTAGGGLACCAPE